GFIASVRNRGSHPCSFSSVPGRALGHFGHAISCIQNVSIRTHARARLIMAPQLVFHEISLSCIDEIHGAASKSAPRHARAEYAAKSASDLDHDVEFGAADFVVVAQATMRVGYEISHCP